MLSPPSHCSHLPTTPPGSRCAIQIAAKAESYKIKQRVLYFSVRYQPHPRSHSRPRHELIFAMCSLPLLLHLPAAASPTYSSSSFSSCCCCYSALSLMNASNASSYCLALRLLHSLRYWATPTRESFIILRELPQPPTACPPITFPSPSSTSCSRRRRILSNCHVLLRSLPVTSFKFTIVLHVLRHYLRAHCCSCLSPLPLPHLSLYSSLSTPSSCCMLAASVST